MPFNNVFMLYLFLNVFCFYFVKHFELPRAEKWYINKIALPCLEAEKKKWTEKELNEAPYKRITL